MEKCFLRWPPRSHRLLPEVGLLAVPSCSGIPPTQLRLGDAQEEGVGLAEKPNGGNWASLGSFLPVNEQKVNNLAGMHGVRH